MNASFLSAVGYSHLAPIIYDFSRWLSLEFTKSESCMIIFGAREGLLLKKCFDQVRNDKSTTSCYFHTSRLMSIRAGSLKSGKILDDEISQIKRNGCYYIRDLAKPLCLDLDLLADACTSNGISIDSLIPPNNLQYPPFERALNDEQLIRDRAERLQKYRQGFSAYLDKIEFPYEGTVIFVDVGWSAQIQCNLRRALDTQGRKNVKIIGCYMGIRKAAYLTRSHMNVVQSFFADELQAGDLLSNGILEFPQLLEFVCRAGHPTIKGIRSAGRYQSSVEIEYKSASEPSRQIEQKQDWIIGKIQEGILAGVSTLSKDNIRSII